MRHSTLPLLLLLMLISVYVHTRARDSFAAAVGSSWSPSAPLRRRMNVVVAGLSALLTLFLAMTFIEDPVSHRALADFAAGMSVFHAAIHSIMYRLLRVRFRLGMRTLPDVLALYLDPRRISYFDMAVYWAVVFIVLDQL
jgi:hypothetical protein